jgi:23S rRNA G2445 N2-methylase RlmL
MFVQSTPVKSIGGSAIRITQSNASRAGVLNYIQVESCAFTKHPWLSHTSNTPPKLLLASNLPFGRRISRIKTKPPNYLKNPLLPLYQSLGNHVNDMMQSGCQFGAMLLTDDRELLRLGGFHTTFTTKLSTTHGGIPVTGMWMQNSNNSASPVMLQTNQQECETMNEATDDDKKEAA